MLSRDESLSAGTRATRGQVLAAAGLSLCLVAAFAATLPFAHLPTSGSEIVLPAYAAATFVLELTTAALLFALYTARRTRAVLLLAAGYLFSALTVPAWALSFPGVFTGLGIDLGLQATAAVAILRRLGFPLFVLAYALAPNGPPRSRSRRHAVAGCVLGVCALAGGLIGAILVFKDHLPAFMLDTRQVNTLWHAIPLAAFGLYGLDMALLLVRRRQALDLWMCLVLSSLVIELVLISYLGGAVRLSVGWWAGRLYGLAAASIVLLALLSETTGLYARLAETTAAERRARQNRLTAMEALSASIAHEINQPLASMVTNADAALRWLGKAEPRLDRVETALSRIVADGHRANKVVTGIRTMFMKGTQDRSAVDLNALVKSAMRTAAGEARYAGITLSTDLDPSLPPVIGNGVQLHQVLCNLIENAIDAIKATRERHREVTIRTRLHAFDEVEVQIADTGAGVPADVMERIFDPFVSTKPGGMGMGLMFCRSIVEAHGGRLRTSPNTPRGAIFHFTLPGPIFPIADRERER